MTGNRVLPVAAAAAWRSHFAIQEEMPETPGMVPAWCRAALLQLQQRLRAVRELAGLSCDLGQPRCEPHEIRLLLGLKVVCVDQPLDTDSGDCGMCLDRQMQQQRWWQFCQFARQSQHCAAPSHKP